MDIPIPPERKDCYAERNRLLREHLGFESYPHYLASSLWKDIKHRGFREHGRFCRICNKYANILHHISYDLETLKGTRLDRLVPVCDICHHAIEFDLLDGKRDLHGAYWEFIRLAHPSQYDRSSRERRDMLVNECGDSMPNIISNIGHKSTVYNDNTLTPSSSVLEYTIYNVLNKVWLKEYPIDHPLYGVDGCTWVSEERYATRYTTRKSAISRAKDFLIQDFLIKEFTCSAPDTPPKPSIGRRAIHGKPPSPLVNALSSASELLRAAQQGFRPDG